LAWRRDEGGASDARLNLVRVHALLHRGHLWVVASCVHHLHHPLQRAGKNKTAQRPPQNCTRTDSSSLLPLQGGARGTRGRSGAVCAS
jgi:hypothetical protein